MDTLGARLRADRILIPLDGSDLATRALSYAEGIGGAGAMLVLFRVARPEDKAAAQAALEAAAADLRRGGSVRRVEVVVAEGDPASRIAAAAREQGADLIVMATSGRPTGGALAYGSVADRVARGATVPVMVVRPDPELPIGAGPAAIRRLVVPLDGSVRAAQAVPVAASLAGRLGVPVGLVTVVDPARVLPTALASDLASGGEFTDGVLVGLRQDAQQALAWGAASLARAGTGPRPDDVRLVQGPTVPCLAEAVGEGDLVVMTGRGRGRRHGRLVGSVTEALIRRVRVPVLVLHATAAPEVIVPAYDEVPRFDRARSVGA